MCRIFKTSVLVILLVIIFNSCSKDENRLPENPTNGKTTAIFSSSVTYGTVTDQDGNVYKTVKIGTQTWMAENLRTTKYNDGKSIENVIVASKWEGLSTGAYGNYNNTTSNDTIATYGRLYNWSAINTGKLAPKGWHVPTDAEWSVLTHYLGIENFVGQKLKEIGVAHWGTPNTEATNETGFTALPGGARNFDGAFVGIEYYGGWWSATERDNDPFYAWCWAIFPDSGPISRNVSDKKVGFSVRCVKD